jgi:ribosome biogenesis protein Nip4
MKMNDEKTFRSINEIEQTIINGSIVKISNIALSALAKSTHELYISESSSRERYFFPMIYLVPNKLSELVNRSKSIVYSSGLYFGFIKKGEFFISLEGANFLHELDCFSDKQIIRVNKEGEKSVLYGNKISKKMISRTPLYLKKNTFIVILNAFNELIAIGQSQVDSEVIQRLDKNGIIALNFVDKGYYLRKQ